MNPARKLLSRILPTIWLATLMYQHCRAADHFVSLSGGNVAPYISWDTAATNIQDAIDAASSGEMVWVTNGIYSTGGKVMAGDLTNRVVLDKPLTVQSVNGPFATTISGAWDPTTTNGPLAIRCAWLTNGATLMGFTLFGGATRTNGDIVGLQSGGGALCSSTNAVVANCLVQSNAAFANGGGIYSGTVLNSAILGNHSVGSGGGTYNALLNSCTVVSNAYLGVVGGRLTNCIVYYNTTANYSGSTPSFCCITPAPAGNILGPPQLLSDGIHLSANSPCLAAGTNVVFGTDIDGEVWANPPSIGCDQWHGLPVIVKQPAIAFTVDPVGFKLSVSVGPEDPFTCQWIKDGVGITDDGHYNGSQTTNLVVVGVKETDAGAYQVVLSNAFGTVTSGVVQVSFHFVSSSSLTPAAPYGDWSTAATNIQDAIDAAQPGDIVLVTNGTYANGGKVMAGDLTNRVVLDKPLLLKSVNGPGNTAIQGMWDPFTTNGPASVRCAWLTNGAIIHGFTLTGGSTRNSGDIINLESGGGAWGSSSNAMVVNSVIKGNSAAYFGGGVYHAGVLKGSVLANVAPSGGGAAVCNLTNCTISLNTSLGNSGGADSSYCKNCAILHNTAILNGGGADGGTLINCTIAWNTASSGSLPGEGGGVYNAKLTNCIIYANQCLYPAYASTSNYYSTFGTFNHCCTMPLPTGVGNIAADPQFLADGLHIAAGSPCIGGSLAGASTGTDIDGQPWQATPAIGCDEYYNLPFVTTAPQIGLSTANMLSASALATGQGPFGYFWLKDGVQVTDGAKYSGSQTANLLLQNFGPEDAGAYQLVASNAFGMNTSAVAQVVVHCANPSSTSPSAPYSDWSTAAATAQDAIDSSMPGDFVLLTNGVYAAGGRVVTGDLTNRMVVNLAIVVASVNGPAATIIKGAWDPGTITGPQAIRCAWLGNGATVQGVTFLGGATRNSGDYFTLQSGGGAWCTSSNALLLGCVLSNNAAAQYGGGAYQGKLERTIVWGNQAAQGAGAYGAFLHSSLVNSNVAFLTGGGVSYSTVINCTVTANTAPKYHGGGVYSCGPINSIVVFNFATSDPFNDVNDYDSTSQTRFISSWTSLPGAFTAQSPQLTADGFHLAATSPCITGGSSAYASGTDIDGEPWANSPFGFSIR